MPIIKVTLIEGYDGATVQRLAARLTDAVRATISAPLEGITVVAHEVKATSYMRGGTSRTPGPAMPGAAEIVQDYLRLMEARDLEAARGYLAEEFEMVFPSGKRMSSLEDLVAWSKTRYKSVSKTFDGWDESFDGDAAVVWARGTLTGEWLDGSAFAGVRFADRFEIVGGKILRQEVWNDLAEAKGAP